MSQLYKYQFKINYFHLYKHSYLNVKLFEYKCLQVEIINFNWYLMDISFYITGYII